MARVGNSEFQEWWRKQKEKRAEYYVPIDPSSSSATNFTGGNIDAPDAEQNSQEKTRTKTRTARQVRWLALLKLQQIFSCLALISRKSAALIRLICRRISSPASDSSSSRMYELLKAMLVLVMLLMSFEVFARHNGWHLMPATVADASEAVEWVYAGWLNLRREYLAPMLQSAANWCVVLFLIQSVDRLLMVLGSVYIKVKGITPKAVFQYPTRKGNIAIDNSDDFPIVLVQIPMCNEREVYQQSIAAVCLQDWPRHRLLVQVLDDSDDEDVQSLIVAEVQTWLLQGVRILYRHRELRTGYKAGNLKSAMSCDYVRDYEFVAIFDADFQPDPDFLKKTIPYFKGNDELALVQARWSFINRDENLLTKLQNINLSFHFEVEQQVNGVFINFFGFNGTAGVWRIKALEDCGGWMERTTVEDMDIAVRAHLCGWNAFVNFRSPLELTRNNNTVGIRARRSCCASASVTSSVEGSYEWIVTKKSGRSSDGDFGMTTDERERAPDPSAPSSCNGPGTSSKSEPGIEEAEKEKKTVKKTETPKSNKIYQKELLLALILLLAAARSLLSAQGIHFYFLLLRIHIPGCWS